MNTLYPVIMSGGAGTRLWPASRQSKPKQYHTFSGYNTLLGETLKRVAGTTEGIEIADPTIICAAYDEAEVKRQSTKVGISLKAVILEPERRNTAPVAFIAAAHIAAMNPDGIILLMPSDHFVHDKDGFLKYIALAAQAAANGQIATLGIRPTRPETGYGYIKTGTDIGPQTYKVDQFVEKPDLPTAQTYLTSGEYFWNAGIFVYRAQTMLDEAKKYCPDILADSLAAYEKRRQNEQVIHLPKAQFAQCRADSIDYAVMEKTQKAVIIAPVDIGWSDVGTWSAIHDILRNDQEPNKVVEQGDVISINSSNTYVHTEGPLVSLVGVEDLIVVVTKDAVLVAHRNDTQDVKNVVEFLKTSGREDLI